MTENDQFDSTGLLPLLDGEVSFDEAPALGDAEVEAARREELEVLGLLALDLEPVAPRAGARERLLAAVAGEPSAGSLAPVVSLEAARTERAAAPTSPGPRRWAFAAAVLAALAGWGATVWQSFELSRVESELARVISQHETLVAELSTERQVRAGEVNRRNEALQLATTRGVSVCPLRPVGEATKEQPESFAVLYMAPAQKWYVKASQLEPPPPGRIYRVWFETPGGPLLVGELRPAPDLDLQFESTGIDPMTMTGVKVTLEPAQPAPAPPAPAGPMVLFGSDKMMVL